MMSLTLLLACQPANRAADGVEQASTVSATSEADSIVLERGSCYRSCPQYRVTVHRGGAVSFTGLANVPRVGSAAGSIAPSAAAALLDHAGTSGVFEMADSIVAGKAACGPAATDLPHVTLMLQWRGRTKRIVQDYGCSGAPRALRQLHARIDSVSGTGQWTGTP